jgi:HEAT repeat protein
MNPTFRSGMISGFVIGAAFTAFAFLLARRGPEPQPAPPKEATAPLPASKPDPVRRVPEVNFKTEPDSAVAKREETPAPEKPAKPDVQALFAKLSESGLAAFRSPKFGEALEAVKASGKPAVEYLSGVLKTSTSATERFMAAALLEGAGDPAGVEALAGVLKNDGDDMVRRMASHALAVIGSPSAEEALRDATVNDSDWGVRANSAYGLAKLGKDDGLRLLREFYESPTTPAEYRLPVLGGLADVAAPSTAPLFRKILTDTKDPSYLLLSIGALEKMKDAGALPALQSIVNSTQPEMIKQAASKAIAAIQK